MKKLIAAVALSALSLSASADFFDPVEEWSYSIAYNVFTHHPEPTYFDEDTDKETAWNEKNEFIGFRVNVNENVGFFAAKGKNSFYKDSITGGVEFHIPLNASDTFDLGSDVGLASGYEDVIDGGILPYVNPFIRPNYHINEHLTASVKVGVMNFMAWNGFFELTVKF
ncbi:MAG: hypothetical protein R3230_00530 [Nitrosopumilaceae archaeon]|nr:hypothetical protein [Nitrosopumilaceae archaeon]